MSAVLKKAILLSLLLALGCESADLDPEDASPCTISTDKCDDAECVGFGADAVAGKVGYYRYQTGKDADGNNIGIQYYVCACNLNDFNIPYEGDNPEYIEADSICKINEVEDIVLPKESDEYCSEIDNFGKECLEDDTECDYPCFDHCNDVIFKDLTSVTVLPEWAEGVTGVGSVSMDGTTKYEARQMFKTVNDKEVPDLEWFSRTESELEYESEYSCSCLWGEYEIRACRTPVDISAASHYESIARISFATAVVAAAFEIALF